jgi:alkylation response protein AidB-like acyl-CoA dehydrogenase
MQYELTEEQNMLRAAVRKVAEEQIKPGVFEADEAERWRPELIDILRDNGLLSIEFPKEYGGEDAGLLAEVISTEELSRVDGTIGNISAGHTLGALPILIAANDDVKKRFLPGLSTGKDLCTFGLTETSGGSDVAGFTTRAEKKGNEYLINGNKIFISNGTYADVSTVYAVTDPAKPQHQKATVFVFRMKNSDGSFVPGYGVGKREIKMGLRTADTVEQVYNDLHVPAEDMVGKEGQAFAIMMKTLDFSRPIIAAQALGNAQGAFEEAVAYAKERVVFGKPIIQHEGIGFMLADMAIQIESARQLLYKASSVLQELSKDINVRLTPEQVRYSSMCKCYATDVGMAVTTNAVQVFGGYGYCRDYPVEKKMRDAKVLQIYEGSNEIQRLVISRTL